MKNTLDFIRNLGINKADYIVVGCSGGPDSMCLLDILYKEKYNVVCAHVNHNIREESVGEYKFLEEYCTKKGIIFEGLELPKNINENESYYRVERYKFYKRLADKYDTKFIMTAHHGDDLIETVLMRITRGSNIKGYLGFPKSYMEGKYRIAKPLVYLTKDQIIEYNDKNDIPYVTDYTNEENNYTRNRYRHNILDFLKKEDKNIHLKYLKYNEELESISNFIDGLVEKALKKNYKDSILTISKFQEEDLLIQKKELESIFRSLYKDDIDKVNENHTKKILNLLSTGKNFKYNLPLGMLAIREYDSLTFKRNEKNENYFIEIKDKVILPDGSTIERIDSSDDTSNYVTRLSSKEMKLPLFVRNRKDGDKMEVKNMNGSKKVKSIFIDEKMNPSIRNSYPIVLDSDDNIIWIPGVKKSKFDIKKDEKYDIILKYIKKKGKD